MQTDVRNEISVFVTTADVAGKLTHQNGQSPEPPKAAGGRSPASRRQPHFVQRLERDLQPKLSLPLIGERGSHFSKIGIAQRGAIVSAGPVEVWRVREIERLESELPANALGHAELAEHREIKVHEPWTIKDIARCCAISSGRGRR